MKLLDFLESTPISYWYLLAGLLLAASAIYFGLSVRQRTRKRLQWAQHHILAITLSEVTELALLIDRDGIIDFINPAAESIFKYRQRSVRGKHYSVLLTLLDPHSRSPLAWFDKARSGTRQFSGEGLLSTASVNKLLVQYSVQELYYAENSVPWYLLLLRDQTELHALQLRLDHMEMHDQQTMLLNSKSFETRLKLALDQVRQHGVKHVFCLIAMDQFKLVNDTLGHSAGDVLIERISRILKEEIDPRRDVLARLGGDEFGILFQEKEPAVAIRAVEQIRQRLEAYEFEWNKVRHKVTASIGFIPLYKGLNTPNRILSTADAACRVAKDKGGNRIHIYKPNDQDVLKQRGNVVWLGRLKKAFEAGNFRLVVQPIQLLEETEFHKPFNHYEVLIRLFDENNQPISPDEFIPAAEYYSMMPRLDRWVVRNLLLLLKEITQKVPRPMFAVNLSGQSLDEPDFLQFVLDEIRHSGISPGMLCFEITERVAIHNLELAQRFIGTLKLLGCSFSLDDFGTGVSSFGYLKSLPVDYLKIDGSFIKEIVTDEVAEAMVRSVNQVGHLMGVQVIAEYVENEQIIQILRDIGVDYGQGYGISRPVALNEVIPRHRL